MTPVHANKNGVRYNYYKSCVLAQGQKHRAGIVSRIPAREIETAALEGLALNLCGAAEHSDLLVQVERIVIVQDGLKVVLKGPKENH